MNVTTLKDTLVARRLALNPWTGFYFLQSLLINLALGYEFSLLYTVAFTCVLHLLWRAFPRVQKAVVGAYSCWRLCTIPLARPTVPQLQHSAGAARHQRGRVYGNPDHLPVVQLSAGGLHLRSRGHCGSP